MKLDYQNPKTRRERWFGLTATALLLHWVLLFGWGLALNNVARGYLYCRLVMLGPMDLSIVPWIFTATALALLMILGRLDQRLLEIRLKWQFLPVIAFLLTQLFAMWHHMMSIRY